MMIKKIERIIVFACIVGYMIRILCLVLLFDREKYLFPKFSPDWFQIVLTIVVGVCLVLIVKYIIHFFLTGKFRRWKSVIAFILLLLLLFPVLCLYQVNRLLLKNVTWYSQTSDISNYGAVDYNVNRISIAGMPVGQFMKRYTPLEVKKYDYKYGEIYGFQLSFQIILSDLDYMECYSVISLSEDCVLTETGAEEKYEHVYELTEEKKENSSSVKWITYRILFDWDTNEVYCIFDGVHSNNLIYFFL